MKLLVEDAVVLHERFETHADLVDHYRNYEASQGRVPPGFMWETLLIALAAFLAEYLGGKALDYVWEQGLPKMPIKPDVRKILTNLASEGHRVRIVLETDAEAEVVQQLRKQLPGVEVTVPSE
ncbi:hypothetical protein SAMN05216404_108153 [Nitrosospira multiformis]|uniref:Uncharacterized protein n=1 Tax=Nitrosospira multiformis TaxID=1231 RepID=A0A1H8KI24_9PROT|nr:hypothetical protein [Nitrosospira multiformis]SEN92544.1 hypothetical protein SAMN05216404_108153 [Nitrosospira multiformis]